MSVFFSHMHVYIFQAVSFLQGFPTNILYAFLLYPTRAACPANITVLYMIALMILREENISLNPIPCNCVQPLVTKSLFVPNIFLRAVLSHTVSLSVCPPFIARETRCFDDYTGKFVALYISVFIFLDIKRKYKRFWKGWQQAYPEFNFIAFICEFSFDLLDSFTNVLNLTIFSENLLA
jgi:hypothetical protein